MPKTLKQLPGLLDSWGRRNRKNPDKTCPSCGQPFRPHRAGSRYCSRRCSWDNNGKVSTERRKPEVWWKDAKGYIAGRVWNGVAQVHVKQHRWLMEKHLGRKLLGHEDVHHINGVKDDNRLENLEVMLHSEHASLSNRLRAISKVTGKEQA